MALSFNASRCRPSMKTSPRSLSIGRPSPSGYPTSVPATESHCSSESSGAVHTGWIWRLWMYAECHRRNSLCTSKRLCVSLCAICLALRRDERKSVCVCVAHTPCTIIQITYDIYAFKTKCTDKETIMCLLWIVDNRNIRFGELILLEIYMKQFIHHSVCLYYNQ